MARTRKLQTAMGSILEDERWWGCIMFRYKCITTYSRHSFALFSPSSLVSLAVLFLLCWPSQITLNVHKKGFEDANERLELETK